MNSISRHSDRSEESLHLPTNNSRGIPRVARNDGVGDFFHKLPKLSASRYLLLSIALALLIACITGFKTTHAQTQDGATPQPATDVRPIQIDRGAAGLWQTLLKLHTRASLLMVVAHPDDEDSGMLALETRGQGTRAMMLTLNRGEGGQNVMSDDFGDALGLVRT